MNRNLTATQNDYALFLPATSGFYATFIGKQRYGQYVDPARIPAAWKSGMESLNYLEPDKGEFYYRWCLYSAGHANLDLTKPDQNEDMFRNRDRSTSWVLGDSGGFQIGKGVWEGEWNDPTGPIVQARMADAIAKGIELVPQVDATGNPKLDKNGNPKYNKIDHVKNYQAQLDAAQKKREQVLAWMDALMDYGMVLDIPAWVARSPAGMKATGISSYDEAVTATKYNNEYFIKHRTGACKFLNVLQGENHDDAERWYQEMKDFCDPTKYDKPFNGWAMGGQNMCDVHLVLERLVALRFDGLLEKGHQDWMHFLGTSKLEWASLLTDIQRAVRKYHNENFTISFDCASPFLATANGQIYIQVETAPNTKWVYRMVPSADDKKYATDTRLFKDAVVQDGKFDNFEPSPLIDQVQIKDICIYAPGDLNKVGKEGNTSWDSFSYAIQMGHNVWSHINAVQEANRKCDSGVFPSMLITYEADKKRHREYEQTHFKDVVDLIFSKNTREEAMAVINQYEDYWDYIIGTRGNTGKRLVNASSKAAEHCEIEADLTFEKVAKAATKPMFNSSLWDVSTIQDHDEVFTEDEEDNLDKLEESIK